MQLATSRVMEIVENTLATQFDLEGYNGLETEEQRSFFNEKKLEFHSALSKFVALNLLFALEKHNPKIVDDVAGIKS